MKSFDRENEIGSALLVDDDSLIRSIPNRFATFPLIFSFIYYVIDLTFISHLFKNFIEK